MLRFRDDLLLRETPLTVLGPVYVRRDMRDADGSSTTEADRIDELA